MSDIYQRFDRAAASYDRVSQLQQQSAQQLLAWMGAVPAGSVWMDAGCGTGVLAKALAAQEARVWAVDRALNMLQPLRSVDGIQVICADLRQLADVPFPDAMLDGLVSNFALHWLQPAIVPQLLRHVRSAGQAWIAVPVQGSLRDVQQRFRGFPLFDFAPVEAWRQAIVQGLDGQPAGQIVAEKTVSLRQTFPHLAALLAALRDMGGDRTDNPAHVPDAQRLRVWLRDRQPIDLNFEVLMLQIRPLPSTADDDDFSALMRRLNADSRFLDQP